MIRDPLVAVAVVLGLTWLGMRWLRCTRRVTPPSWFMVAEPRHRSWNVVPAPPYDWSRDPET